MNSAILVPPLTLVSQIQCILFIISSYVKIFNRKIVGNIFSTGSVLAGEQVCHGGFFSQNVFNRGHYYRKSEAQTLGFKADVYWEYQEF